MELAEEMGISPLEALLYSVRLAAQRVAETELQLTRAREMEVRAGKDPAYPSKAVKEWTAESRRERSLLAKTAQTAIHGGLSAALAHRLESEALAVADAVTAALDVLGLEAGDRVRALEAAQTRLMALSQGPDTDETISIPAKR